MTRWLNRFQPWGIFFLRLVLGVAMVVHGYPKVVPPGGLRNHNMLAALNHHAAFVGSLGVPAWLGYASSFAELVGGLLLVLGLLTRFAAFLVTVNMLAAIILVDRHQGYSGSEYSLALAAMAFLVLLTGPGKAALDRRLGLS
jgi:putative oxidoreductase